MREQPGEHGDRVEMALMAADFSYQILKRDRRRRRLPRRPALPHLRPRQQVERAGAEDPRGRRTVFVSFATA